MSKFETLCEYIIYNEKCTTLDSHSVHFTGPLRRTFYNGYKAIRVSRSRPLPTFLLLGFVQMKLQISRAHSRNVQQTETTKLRDWHVGKMKCRGLIIRDQSSNLQILRRTFLTRRRFSCIEQMVILISTGKFSSTLIKNFCKGGFPHDGIFRPKVP